MRPPASLRLLATVCLAIVTAQACAHVRRPVQAQIFLDQQDFPEISLRPTQVVVVNGWEIVVDSETGRLLYRLEGSTGSWQMSPIELRRPHAIAAGGDGQFYAADTDNNRVVRFSDLSQADFTSFSTLSGQPLVKPHDIVLEPESGHLYVIDSQSRVYRFRELGVDEAFLQFDPAELGYSRSLSVVHGTVYVICSSKGRVIRIDDFGAGAVTLFTSPGKSEDAAQGSWETTGLVLNDVEYFNGHWYGTNFFVGHPHRAHKANRFSFIRWRTWDDFEDGRWDDLSHLLEPQLVPYFLFVHGDRMYLSCIRGRVYVVF